MYCADIITFNTIALKGAIRDIGRAMGIDLSIIDEISKTIEEDGKEDKYRELYPNLFKYVDIVNGTIVSVGSHPCGTVVSPFPIEGYLGTFTTATSKYPITQVNMKEIDCQNFVKLDLLGLDNVEIINETCKLAGIETLTPDNMDDNDEEVWMSIHESNLGVFQWESSYSHSYFKELFSKKTIQKIKENNSNFRYLDLFSVGNGAIRPSGASYRDKLSQGIFRDNGHKALNDFLSPTLNYLVYQEQVLEFLHSFCGFTMGEADVVRRGFAKKLGTEEFMPKIKAGFIKTMNEKYNVCTEEAEVLIVDFLQVIEDASEYLFSLNHSQSYSYIGYACAYLRYYYPLEFLTVLLNINQGNTDKTSATMEYAKLKNIMINPPKFRYSKSTYMCDKETSSIYKGINSIKYLNAQVGDDLYSLRENKYNSFLELLSDLSEKQISINSRQMIALIKLDFFEEFGKSKKILAIYDYYTTLNGKKQLSKEKLEALNLKLEIVQKYSLKETAKIFKELDINSIIKDSVDLIEDKSIPLRDKLATELEYLGYCASTISKAPKNFYFVLSLEVFKNKRSITYYPTLYNVKTGVKQKYKIKDWQYFSEAPFKENFVIKVLEETKEFKRKLVDGKWTKSDSEYNYIINNWQVC